MNTYDITEGDFTEAFAFVSSGNHPGYWLEEVLRDLGVLHHVTGDYDTRSAESILSDLNAEPAVIYAAQAAQDYTDFSRGTLSDAYDYYLRKLTFYRANYPAYYKD
jgi:hypothetical protein